MKFTTKLFAAATAVALIATSASAESWRAWNIHNDGHPNTAAMDKFAELVDAATGGLLGGLGTLVSGAGGAALGRYGVVRYADEIGQLKVRGIPTGGSKLYFGPSRNPNFPFVLLGRGLEHHRLLARRTHAHREILELNNPLLDMVSEDDRRKLGRIFADIRREKELPRRQAELAELVYQYALRADL